MITHEQRHDIVQKFLTEKSAPVMKAKGRDYAGTDHQPDVNANFKRAAARWGVPVLAAWGVYFGKHIDAIETYVRTGGQAESEPILGRITDAVNYLFILLALLEDPDLSDLDQMDDPIITPVPKLSGNSGSAYSEPVPSEEA